MILVNIKFIFGCLGVMESLGMRKFIYMKKELTEE